MTFPPIGAALARVRVTARPLTATAETAAAAASTTTAKSSGEGTLSGSRSSSTTSVSSAWLTVAETTCSVTAPAGTTVKTPERPYTRAAEPRPRNPYSSSFPLLPGRPSLTFKLDPWPKNCEPPALVPSLLDPVSTLMSSLEALPFSFLGSFKSQSRS